MKVFLNFFSVLRIRDVYPGSRIRLFSIPDPGSELSPSRIRIKEFKYFNKKKLILSSRKFDPGCFSGIPDPDADFLPTPIPDPGVNRIRNTDFFSCGWKDPDLYRVAQKITVSGSGHCDLPFSSVVVKICIQILIIYD